MKFMLLNQEWSHALGMSLLHSLWQITLIYFILRALLYILRRSPALTRYRLSLAALAFIPVIMLITFFHYHHTDTSLAKELIKLNYDNFLLMGEPGGDISPAPGHESPYEARYMPWLVNLYLAGIFFLSLRFLFSLYFLERFKNKGTVKVSGRIENHLRILGDKLKIGKSVRLIESGHANTALVLGFLKPLIIVPAGIFTHLPFNQVEAILLHELAHIKRNDYLVNIIHSVVEILLFYHPLIYLISKRIRLERENCCDDLALRHFDSSIHYVKALASMEEFKLTSPYPAVAFAESGTLLTRIKRILKPQTMKTRTTDRLLAGIIILAGISIMFISGAAGLNKEPRKSGDPYHSVVPSINLHTSGSGSSKDASGMKDTTLRVEENRIITSMKDDEGNEHQYEMEFRGGKLIELKIDGEKIPEKDFPEYKQLVESTLLKVKDANRKIAKAEKEMAELDKEEIRRELEESMKKVEEIEWEKITAEMEKYRSGEEQARLKAEMEKARAEMEAINFDSIRLEIEEAMRSLKEDSVHVIARQALEEAARSMEETDWEEMEQSVYESLEEARASMQNIDWEKIGKDIEESLQESQVDLRELEAEIRESLSDIDIEKIMKDISESRLGLEKKMQELQKMEQEMEKSLEELEKK